jgi:hypothetical protein
MLGKIIRNGKSFEFVKLNEFEVIDVLRNITEINVIEFLTIYSQIKRKFSDMNNRLTTRELIDATIAVFSSCAVRCYPALQSALNSKVNDIKGNNGYEDEYQRESAIQQHAEQLREEAANSETEESP